MAGTTGEGGRATDGLSEKMDCEEPVEEEGQDGLCNPKAQSAMVQAGITLQPWHGEPQPGSHVPQLGKVAEAVLDQELSGRPPQKLRKVEEDQESADATSGAGDPGGKVPSETPRDAQEAVGADEGSFLPWGASAALGADRAALGEGESKRRLQQGLDLEISKWVVFSRSGNWPKIIRAGCWPGRVAGSKKQLAL